jgi:hypothetical protein
MWTYESVYETLHVLKLRVVSIAEVFGSKDRIPGMIGFETER